MPTMDKHDGAKLAKEEVARVISNLVKFLPLVHHRFHSLPVEVHLLACVLALYFWLASKDEKKEGIVRCGWLGQWMCEATLGNMKLRTTWHEWISLVPLQLNSLLFQVDGPAPSNSKKEGANGFICVKLD